MNPSSSSGTSLVVAADSVRARLFAAATPTAPLQEIGDLSNPEGRLHEGDLVEDATGRRGTRPTQAKHSAFGGQSAKRHRAEEFAAKVCELAAGALRDNGAERLYIVAEPEFLGILRQRMDRSVQRCVAGEVAKSLATRTVDEIRAVLPSTL